MNLELTTNISKSDNHEHAIRGHKLLKLIKEKSLTDVIFLLWRGSFPSKKEKQLFESMWITVLEHGIAPPSTFIPRVVASTGNSLSAALASSALAIGPKHGGAIEAAAQLLSLEKTAAEIVSDAQKNNRRLAGFGHAVYKDADPRATLLFQLTKKLKFSGKYFKKAYQIEKELAKTKNKTIPLNIDGAIAAGILELGFDPRLANAFFIIPRLIGSTAHVLEEMDATKKYHRLKK